MISPTAGVAFTAAEDGDVRSDRVARRRVSDELGIPSRWATARQIHGGLAVEATDRGDLGEADAIFTSVPGLPVAVFTADCLGVVVRGLGGVGVAHAGWRGIAAGVISTLRHAMDSAGLRPTHAYLGPAIGPCCFEVGQDVSERFPGEVTNTSWGTVSVDLTAAALRQLTGLRVWESGRCTMHEPDLLSHRADATPARMASIGWLVPQSGASP